MSARSETYDLMARLSRGSINASFEQANTLRRAQLTLRRWAELECGTDGGCIERDETTGKVYWHNSYSGRLSPMAGRETPALARVAAVCKELGAHFYHQTDPRGCALHVSLEPLSDQTYNRGVAIY